MKQLLESVTCPVLLVKPPQEPPFRLKVGAALESGAARRGVVAMSKVSQYSPAAVRLTVCIMLLVAWAIAVPAGAATPAEIHVPRLAPTTVMEKEMEALRQELNALAQETQRIQNTLDAALRRELLQAHLIRLREVAISMRAMESRMHAALDSGQIASDRGARERHAFLLDQVAMTTALLESALVETPTRGTDCK